VYITEGEEACIGTLYEVNVNEFVQGERSN
jgi:hypothetical protein